jgi:hypothetical protein
MISTNIGVGLRAVGWLGGLAAVFLLSGCPQNAPRGQVLLPPPADGEGFQLDAPHFSVPSGTEIQNCYFFAVPGETGKDVWIDHFTLAANTGTHHVNVFRVKTVVNLGGQPGDAVLGQNGEGPCFKSSNWADWPLVVNNQDGGSIVDWKLPAGVAQKFTGGELLMLQIHFVNAQTQTSPDGGRAAVNFYNAPGVPANELGTIFATNQQIRICPGETKTFETHCNAPLSNTTVVAANGHFHSRGTEFTMNVVDAMGNTTLADPFYVSEKWDDPPMARDLAVTIPEGGAISWSCTYTVDPNACSNDKDSCCYTFGGKVESQEHCNAFVYYYPKIQDYSCF